MKSRLWLFACLLLTAGTVFRGCHVPQKEKLPLVHAHRGGAALYPENTILAMTHAVATGVPVMELDLHVTKDSMVVVSHDAYLNHVKTLTPEGEPIPAGKDKDYKIYAMTYDSLRRYDVGSLPNPAYPRRKNVKCCVPRVTDLIDSVELLTESNGIAPVGYNIEIKSDPLKDSIYSPDYRTFADLRMKVLLSKKLGDRLLVQCFDARTLNYLHEKYPDVRLSYLVEDKNTTFEELMSRLDFVPQVYSPQSDMLTEEIAVKVRAKGMELAPWTVDDKPETGRLKKLGVDAIITNRPDSLMQWLGYPQNKRKE